MLVMFSWKIAGPKKYLKKHIRNFYNNTLYSPPQGKLEKEFLDKVILVSFVKLSRMPDNSDTELPSMLNSSNAQQFFSDWGIFVSRL